MAPDDAVILQESGLVSPPLSDGTRRIHKRCSNRSSDEEEEEHIPLSPVSIASSSDSFVSILEHLTSFAALDHLGSGYLSIAIPGTLGGTKSSS
ncbi:hypothetical protein N7465_005916 [Penicillium sp. CMV-2018d]|nr:hypothetical protein N7465_005916 [Penicillium sp. CMV-2018d]